MGVTRFIRSLLGAAVLFAVATPAPLPAADRLHPPVDDIAYMAHCGVCHPAYPPEWLPAAAWQRILDTLADHFGEWVELDAAPRRHVGRFLQGRSRDRSSSPLAVRLRETARSAGTARITATAYFTAVHREAPLPAVPSGGVAIAGCHACHIDVEQGNYDLGRRERKSSHRQ